MFLCRFQQERTFAHLQMPGFVRCLSIQFPAQHTLNSCIPRVSRFLHDGHIGNV